MDQRTAALWLWEQLAAVFGKQAVYRAGSAALLLPVVPGQSVIDGISASGGMVQFTADDYMVRASDLELAGNVFLPEKGQRIEIFDDLEHRTRVYEVLPPAPAQPVYTHADPGKHLLRIHTKELRQDSRLP